MSLTSVVLLALSGCSHENDDEGQRPRADRPPAMLSATTADAPPCDQVWVEGELLPFAYTGCERDGARILPDRSRCHDRSGREFVSYPDGGLYAQAGGPIKHWELPTDFSGTLPSIDLCGHGSPVDLTLDCDGHRMSSGTFDYVPPRSAAQGHRQGWPRSPRQAVEGMLAADRLRSVGAVKLSRGVPSTDPRGPLSFQFAALTAAGTTVAVISVDRLFVAVWAVSRIEQCA